MDIVILIIAGDRVRLSLCSYFVLTQALDLAEPLLPKLLALHDNSDGGVSLADERETRSDADRLCAEPFLGACPSSLRIAVLDPGFPAPLRELDLFKLDATSFAAALPSFSDMVVLPATRTAN